MSIKNISIFGSTGSIGVSSLKVIDSLNGRYKVFSLSAQRNMDALKAQVSRYAPRYVCVADERLAAELESYLKRKRKRITVLTGDGCLEACAGMKEADILIMAIVGFAGLKPLLNAVKLGKRVALANKEVLVAAGDIIMKSARRYGTEIFPIDSEHSAIFQCLRKESPKAVRNIILTASGGSFYKKTKKEMGRVTVAEALKHPNWKMGRKITVDSATLMNKGLEAIEAHHLFGVPMEKIKILIHPQSIIHSMVEFVDGSIIAQLSKPDMRLPIRYSLTYPERVTDNNFSLDLEKTGRLDFYKPDISRFPCLKLALDAANKGGIYPVVLNAANEVAVKRFIAGEIGFTDIPKLIKKVLKKIKKNPKPGLENIFFYDNWARKKAERIKI